MDEKLLETLREFAEAIKKLRRDIRELPGVREATVDLRQRVANLEHKGTNNDLAGVIHELQGQVKELNRRLLALEGAQRGGSGSVKPPPPPPPQGIPRIPTTSGSYVLWLESSLVETPRFVHFSFDGTSFKIRDYQSGRMQFQPGGKRQPERNFSLVEECQFNRDEVWQLAKLWIPAQQDLYKPVSDFDWWCDKLQEMEHNRDRFAGRSLRR